MKWSKSTSTVDAVAARDAGDDDDDLVEVAVEGAVAAGDQVGEAAERGADERPLVVEVVPT